MKSHSPTPKPSQPIPEKLKIIIRMRPILEDEDPDNFVQLSDDNTLHIKKPSNHSYMKFHNILPPDSTQKDVFMLVEESVRDFIGGGNVTIFAYGQTGAGKTYTIIGNYSRDSRENLFNFLSSRDRGVLSRSLELVMACLQKNAGYRVLVSFYQIYNEKIFDLYSNTMAPLDIRQSKSGQISIPSLLNIQVRSMQEVIEFLMVGLKNRSTGSTYENAQSSRSHSIFQIKLCKEGLNGQSSSSMLRIVDLAGSEKFKIPSNLSQSQKEMRIQELTSINGSLSCLGHCISSLISKERTHIPFRNSKLTRILSDSLLGSGKLRFIICISPSLSSSAETFSTLQFANRAKKAIFQKFEPRTPTPQKKTSQNPELKQLKTQLQLQKKIRKNLQQQISIHPPELSQDLVHENLDLRKQNQVLKQQLKEIMIRKCTRRSESPSISLDLASNVSLRRREMKEEMLRLPVFQNRLNLEELERRKTGELVRGKEKILSTIIKVPVYLHNNVDEIKKRLPKSLRCHSKTQTQIPHNRSITSIKTPIRPSKASNKENTRYP